MFDYADVDVEQANTLSNAKTNEAIIVVGCHAVFSVCERANA